MPAIRRPSPPNPRRNSPPSRIKGVAGSLRRPRPTPSMPIHSAADVPNAQPGYRGQFLKDPGAHSPAQSQLQMSQLKRYNANIVFKDEEHLQVMMEDLRTWSPQELRVRRRIFRFRPQLNHFPPDICPLVTLNWDIIDSSQWDGNKDGTYSVSVIAHDQRTHVTSVDIINSAECFFSTHLCTQEKNRIRRGFECWQPLTLQKGEHSLYQLMQSFVNPKPRNIDKSVKVFSARHYVDAVKKIFGNYMVTVDLRIGGCQTPQYSHPEHWASDLGNMDEHRRLIHLFLPPLEQGDMYRRQAEPAPPLGVAYYDNYGSVAAADNSVDRRATPASYADYPYANGISGLGNLPPLTRTSRPSVFDPTSYSLGAGNQSNTFQRIPSSLYITLPSASEASSTSTNGFHLSSTPRYPNGSANSYATTANDRLYQAVSDDVPDVAPSSTQRDIRPSSLLDFGRAESTAHLSENGLQSSSASEAWNLTPRPFNGQGSSHPVSAPYSRPSHTSSYASESVFGRVFDSPQAAAPSTSDTVEFPTTTGPAPNDTHAQQQYIYPAGFANFRRS